MHIIATYHNQIFGCLINVNSMPATWRQDNYTLTVHVLLGFLTVLLEYIDAFSGAVAPCSAALALSYNHILGLDTGHIYFHMLL